MDATKAHNTVAQLVAFYGDAMQELMKRAVEAEHAVKLMGAQLRSAAERDQQLDEPRTAADELLNATVQFMQQWDAKDFAALQSSASEMPMKTKRVLDAIDAYEAATGVVVPAKYPARPGTVRAQDG